jgi:hypothetical protein
MDWWTDPIEQQPTWGWGWTKREEEEMLERARGGIGGTGGIRPLASLCSLTWTTGQMQGGCNCSLQHCRVEETGGVRRIADAAEDGR